MPEKVCFLYRRLASDELGVQLSPFRKAQLRLHTYGCADCRGYQADLAHMAHALKHQGQHLSDAMPSPQLMAAFAQASQEAAHGVENSSFGLQRLMMWMRGWRGIAAVCAMLASSAALAAAALGPPTTKPALSASQGLMCFVVESIAGLSAAVALVIFTARRRSPLMPLGAAAAAGLAGLCAQAATQLHCPAPATLPHIFIFHFGAVVLVVATAFALASWYEKRRLDRLYAA